MSKRKLLLADDSVTVQKVVNLAFESENIEVITADDGMTAFEKILEFSPDMVMADINLPGADGYEICEHIKQNEATKHIPVILLVGSFEPFSEERAERVGAEGFLKKPFQSIGLLINKVTELLDKNKSGDSGSTETNFNEADTQPIPVYNASEMPDSDDDYSINEELGETGMDDEMIETERVGDYSLLDETSKYETNTEFDISTEEDSGLTQPMTYAEVEELELDQNDQTVYELADEPDEHLSDEIYDSEEFNRKTEENSANDSDLSEDYPDYGQTQEKANFTAQKEAADLDLNDFELLELPPLETLGEPISPDYSEFNQPAEESSATDDTPTDTEQNQTAEIKNDYSDQAETTAEEPFSMPQTEKSNETPESYYAPAEEEADSESLETQLENVEEIEESGEPETAEFKESENTEETSVEEKEISAMDSGEPTAQNFEEEKSELPKETYSETQAMIAQETQQVVSQSSDNKVIVHYLPPEVIDEIAERVVEKLAEKLRR